MVVGRVPGGARALPVWPWYLRRASASARLGLRHIDQARSFVVAGVEPGVYENSKSGRSVSSGPLGGPGSHGSASPRTSTAYTATLALLQTLISAVISASMSGVSGNAGGQPHQALAPRNATHMLRATLRSASRTFRLE